MKRLEDALADNDNILGIVLGSATNHSADAVSITRPHAASQARLSESILHVAGVDPLDVGYVEMHGTGTQFGDLNEIQSVTDVFAPTNRERKSPLYLGTVKANIGHGESAAGVTSLIKILLMMRENAVPPHVGIKTTINRSFPTDLKARNVHIPKDLVQWKENSRARFAFLNNFSAAGGNSALLLQDAPRQPVGDDHNDRKWYVVALSAKSVASLRANMLRLVVDIDQNSLNLPSLSYTSTSRRIHHSHRVAFSVSDTSQLKDALRKQEADFEGLVPKPRETPNVVFIFSGQGSFYLGIGKDLFRTSPTFQESILNMDKLANMMDLPSIIPLIRGDEVAAERDALSTSAVQLTLLCVQMALAQLWQSWGIKPTAVIGHSLGEYAALMVAGVLSIADTIALVGARARLLENKCTPGTHSMLAIRASPSTVHAALLKKDYEMVCWNADEESVIAGTSQNMEDLSRKLYEMGHKSTTLKVPYAFHSAQMEPIMDDFLKFTSRLSFRKPRIPYISSTLGRVSVKDSDDLGPQYLVKHLRSTVLFSPALKAALNDGLLTQKTHYVEIGPHPTCSAMVKSLIPDAKVVASLHKTEAPWESLTKSLAKLYVDNVGIEWSGIHKGPESSLRPLDFPKYCFDTRNYWIDYVNDWCLTKGSTPPAIPSVKCLRLWEQESRLSTSTIHSITLEDIGSDGGTFKVQTDMTEPFLRSLVFSHLVNGTPLCPSVSHHQMIVDVLLTLL